MGIILVYKLPIIPQLLKVALFLFIPNNGLKNHIRLTITKNIQEPAKVPISIITNFKNMGNGLFINQ